MSNFIRAGGDSGTCGVLCRLQIGYLKRLECTEAFAISWKFMVEEDLTGKKVVI